MSNQCGISKRNKKRASPDDPLIQPGLRSRGEGYSLPMAPLPGQLCGQSLEVDQRQPGPKMHKLGTDTSSPLCLSIGRAWSAVGAQEYGYIPPSYITCNILILE